MPRETKAAKSARAVEVCRRLDALYGPVECFLNHESPFHLVIAVLLSAQTTDAQVNRVTPELFRRWPAPADLAAASPVEVAEVIRSLGFYKTKARHCVECAQTIVSDFGGEVPHTMGELTSLPGVGRKTANIVLNVSFGIVEGIAQDRAGPPGHPAARAVERREPPVDPLRARGLPGALAQVRGLPLRGHLPERASLLSSFDL